MFKKTTTGDNGLANHFNGFHSEAAYNKFLGYIKFCTDTDVNLGKAELHTLMVFKNEDKSVSVYINDNRYDFKDGKLRTVYAPSGVVEGSDLVFLNTLVLNDWRIASAAIEEEDYA